MNGPPESSIERASREARDRIATVGTAEIAPPIPRQPASGQFAPKPHVREVPVKDTPNALLGEEPEPGRDTPAPVEEAPAPAAADEAGDPPPADEPATDDVPDDLLVTIPGRREGEDFEIEVADKDAADRLRQLTNGYMRGEQARALEAEISERAAEVEAIREEAVVDPIGFLNEALAVGYTPAQIAEIKSNIALDMLTDPEVWEKIGERVMNFDDETERRTALLDAREARQKMRDEGVRAVEESRAVSTNLRDVQDTVVSLMDEGWDEEAQGSFWQDALGEIKRYAEEMNLLTVSPSRIPIILAEVLSQHGQNPVEAAQRVATRRAGTKDARTNGARRPAAAASAPKGPAPRRTVARTSEDVVQRAQQRRVAAAIPGSGAGAPSSAPTPPAGQSIEERTAWHKQQLASGRRLLSR